MERGWKRGAAWNKEKPAGLSFSPAIPMLTAKWAYADHPAVSGGTDAG